MKLFLKNTFAFLSLPILGLILIFFVDYDREFAWNFIKRDCSDYSHWIYNRIYHNPKPIDVAFIGSSVTKSSVNDFYTEQAFQKQTQLNWHFANLSFCQFGRNLYYVLLKDLLKERRVKYVVLEIRQDENFTGHPLFPYLADTESLCEAPLFLNHKYFSDLYLASVSRIEYWKQNIFYQKKVYETEMSDYGHAYWGQIVDSTLLEKVKLGEIKLHERQEFSIFRAINLRYPRYYIKKISQLCKANGAELLFLYTPFYGGIEFLPKELEFYKKYGEVFIPPPDVFVNKKLWADQTHINIHGAKPNSFWFADVFVDYIKSKEK
jgi:hypothetical protein